MAVELRVPEAGESVTEVEVGEWLRAPGDRVERDEPLVVLETDKAAMEVPAPIAGVLAEILCAAGQTVKPGDVLCRLEEAAGAPAETGTAASRPTPADTNVDAGAAAPPVTPAARRLLAKHGLRAAEVRGTGPGGRLLKEDVLRHVELAANGTATEAVAAAAPAPAPSPVSAPAAVAGREEQVVRMSLLRRRVAQRLVEAQQTAALLTTFNEIDMSAVVALRQQHQGLFQERYGIKLGFMSFFVKAAVDALKGVPQLNAEIRGEDLVYWNYYDLGVAVGTDRGLVVPVLRNADRLSFAETELAIADFAEKAKTNRLAIEDLQGGTFSLSNGGLYGSLLSTPIVNPPQSGILGMHAIQDRPVARDGQVVIRPMMYVALTYDHRIVDGKEAVTFLRRVKDCVEAPARMLLEV
ncbi:MAG: dihydrolipoyllysine-residue succinyltransferase [Armatimonadetes bacterium CG_4_10_14_3_um_filter_66_18]|nr:2-oxoglutarate dehydrogenase complex dihydrolipoyllysine-residue succinyltransferase [Armatimonadota bacterium]PIU95868.1 MAG: dihydrolipoyllysine-residue succinyltransferase [Armatimonadetes bacterium CG06_land_8_20_14_3_00_66_21]PIY44537.1 MAG: dihydrolipoyllysine-residue succinyltransferase [Armatimonadetes bacterium CG_4_10_14_3_um_filter_66_18]PIZ30136.1 MAG: dihydrolipoyllysine-residue succinyltransferase [Armatimonadetes bacterium CG_4_10_14_0_8_um_filter_66_14]PJB62890.1 MAG: dihydro